MKVTKRLVVTKDWNLNPDMNQWHALVAPLIEEVLRKEFECHTLAFSSTCDGVYFFVGAEGADSSIEVWASFVEMAKKYFDRCCDSSGEEEARDSCSKVAKSLVDAAVSLAGKKAVSQMVATSRRRMFKS